MSTLTATLLLCLSAATDATASPSVRDVQDVQLINGGDAAKTTDPSPGAEPRPEVAISSATARENEGCMHLCNPQRTGYSPSSMRPPYRQVWVYTDRHKPRPAWKEPAWEPQRIDFDYAYAVSIGNQLAYFASSADHTVHALEMKTGEQQWKFFTQGPVRLAPTVHDEKVYFGSDDGYVYCLDAFTGQQIWQFRPKIPDERLIGNEQMISRWPARSGVLVEDGRLYTTFGMLSPEGIFVCCLDAGAGTVIWMNDTSGTRYMARPHVPGMGGVSPQGYLAVCGDTLVVPCGRATPALFDKRTGQILYHESEGDFAGGAWTTTFDNIVFTPCESLIKEYGSSLRRSTPADQALPFASASLVALDSKTGREVFTLQGGRKGVISDAGIMTLVGLDGLVCVDLSDVRRSVGQESTIRHTTGHFVSAAQHQLWQRRMGVVYSLLQAGKTLIAGGRETVAFIDVRTGKQLWDGSVEGQVRDMCVKGGHLLVSTTAGKIYCYRSGDNGQGDGLLKVSPVTDSTKSPIEVRNAAREVLTNSGVTSGYCLVLGDATAGFLAEMAEQSQLMVYHVADRERVLSLRSALDRAGLYGVRVAVHTCSTRPLPYAQYFADLVVVNAVSSTVLDNVPAKEVYRALRPYGGKAMIRFPDSMHATVLKWLSKAGISADSCHRVDGGMVITRGKLEGAGQWTHQYADPGKTCASEDQLVRLPLKALWFGGLGPAKVVSRHFRTPAPLVLDGRCFLPVTDHLIAMDIYSGRILWQRELPELAHWPAAYRGPSLAVDSDAVYALQGKACLALAPKTGRKVTTYRVPPEALSSTSPENNVIWEFLAVTDDLIIGAVGKPNVKQEWWSKAYPVNWSLFAIDKSTGKTRWIYRPVEGIDSNAIAISGGRVFVVDGRPRYDFLLRQIERDGPAKPRFLKALDAQSGQVLWETTDVVGTQNSLWAGGGAVISTVNPFSRTMEDKIVAKAGGGACVYSAKDGSVLWKLKEVPTCSPMIIGGTLHLPAAYDLMTGEPVQTENPLTGQTEHFVPGFPKTCSMYSGSPNLLMSRSGSLGFYDLRQRSGYYHYPILRASCWINMIPAGGVVMIPEGSSSCVCGYNYKTSIALVSAERGNHYGIRRIRKNGDVASLYVNFGAPGDRPDNQGRIWLAYPRPVAYGRPLAHAKYGPKIGGGTLPIEVSAGKDSYEIYSRNPDWIDIEGTDRPWLHACGLKGNVKLQVRLSGHVDGRVPYQVGLHFCALENLTAIGTFDVKLQGKMVLSRLDILEQAGRTNKALTKLFRVLAGDILTVELTSNTNGNLTPIISGISITKED